MRPLLSLLLLLFTGCAHYYAPVNRLESPEATGTHHIGKLELLGTQSGTDLNEATTTVTPTAAEGETPDPPYEKMAQSWVNPFLAFTRGVTDSLDVSVRISPAAPILVRGKYQFSGDNEEKAGAGNFSTAASASVGLLLASAGVTSFQLDGAFLAGYRPWRRHLFSLAPMLTFTSISGLPTAAPAASGSLIQYGGGLGYQYSVESLFFRLELSYALGSSAENQVVGIFGGASLGFNL